MAKPVTIFLLLSGLLLVAGLGDDDKKNCVTTRKDDGPYLLCVEAPPTVQVGQDSSFTVFMLDRSEVEPANVDDKYLLEGDGVVDGAPAIALLNISLEHAWVAEVKPNNSVVLDEGVKFNITLASTGAGKTNLVFNCTNGEFNSTDCPFTKEYLEAVSREVSVAHSLPLNVIIDIVGWIYFLAWSISYYPQIILNIYRRSVIGLNFDFLLYNILGFLCYSAFNIGLYWIPEILREYFSRHSSGVNPVLLNDVIFCLHATAATSFTILQCFIFKRGKQRVSYTACILFSMMIVALLVCLFTSVAGKLAWLDFLYAASYIKLAVTIVKYVPQAYYNFRRRSTRGWSIGSVLLDFTGGVFSILQMFLLAYNYEDWKSIFGDPTKFGLGVFSMIFDIIFMLQHYVLFRNAVDTDRADYSKIVGPSIQEDVDGVDERKPLLGKAKMRKNRLKEIFMINNKT